LTSFWVKQAGGDIFYNAFFEKFAAKLDRPAARLTPNALETLMQFDWLLNRIARSEIDL
jgi:hypothetical protein